MQTLKNIALWIVGLFALAAAFFAFVAYKAAQVRARAGTAAKQAQIEVQLFKDRQRAKLTRAELQPTIDKKHAEQLRALQLREAEIKRAADDSKAALVTELNRSFGL